MIRRKVRAGRSSCNLAGKAESEAGNLGKLHQLKRESSQSDENTLKIRA